MLNHITIRNFAIVKSLDLDLTKGMSAITGETGAGKSIAIDALNLCLGARAEASMVRPNEDKAEIIASFSVTNNDRAMGWLVERELDNGDDCIIRRIISSEGRSRAFINGVPTPVQQLKDLGQWLISIHGQHGHQRLLKADNQRQLLDQFADHREIQDAVKSDYKQLNTLRNEYKSLKQAQEQRQARKQLLDYQVVELNEFALAEGEFEQLESDHKRLSNSQSLLESSQYCFHRLYEDEQHNAVHIIQSSIQQLSELQSNDSALVPVVEILNEALINVDEASSQLQTYIEHLEIDPFKIQQVEARYSQCLAIARKHNIAPEVLALHHKSLLTEHKQLSQDESKLDDLLAQIEQQHQTYTASCEKLHKSRKKAAGTLAKTVEDHIKAMNMQDARFVIDVDFDTEMPASQHGADVVSFNIATNAGQPLDAIEKVVSGGELSRIGLALQVINSSSHAVPTMIFDEVDVGISGPTATVVGQLLRSLGQNVQTLCVTHLPQVAAQAHQQMFVTKFSDGTATQTNIQCLNQDQRVEELARLLGSDVINDTAIANAKAMLEASA